MGVPPLSLLIALGGLVLLSRPYLEARRPVTSLMLLAGIVLGSAGAGLIPREAVGAAGPLQALAAGWLALSAAESWVPDTLRRIVSGGRLARLLIPVAVLGAIGCLVSPALGATLAALALALDPDAARCAL